MSQIYKTPLELVKSIVVSNAGNTKLELSIYDYQPQTVEDKRTIFHAMGTKLEDEVRARERDLKEGQDIAFHSIVKQKGRALHFPMGDTIGQLTRKEARTISQIVREFGVNKTHFFKSGRSYHFYGAGLIPEEKLNELFGRLLLLNNPGRRQVIDPRWVGHRLIAGYGALRWTSNNLRYKSLPEGVSINSFPGE